MTGSGNFPPGRSLLIERLAMAMCWDFSVGKATTPRRLFLAQTEGCKERFRLMARDLLPCITKSGLRLAVAPKTTRLAPQRQRLATALCGPVPTGKAKKKAGKRNV